MDYRLEESTPKLGGLRIYVADRFDDDGEFDGAWADAAGALVEAAETVAEKTCEACAGPGRPRFNVDRHGTWILTLCGSCHTTWTLLVGRVPVGLDCTENRQRMNARAELTRIPSTVVL